MKRIFVLAGMWALLTVLVGCGGGSSSTAGTGLTANSLVGTWRTTRLRSPAGATTTCPGSVTLSNNTTADCNADDDTIFQADGTIATLIGGVPTTSGVWSLNGSTLQIAVPTFGGQITVNSTVALSGTTLTLTIKSSTPSNPEIIGLVTTMVKR